MKLTFNPFKLRRQVKYYATQYSKQAVVLINANEHIAELIAENMTLRQRADDLANSLEHAQFEIKRYRAIEQVVTHGKGFSL
ncbi:hypothetical protein E4T80_11905 [Muribacter muris]|uniref:Uncharacterized protein n=1 Tax=Muribacter muris TaxID=67855 RepID=A0A4Y9JRZ6_9PAST|nr:hypothetical protein [Muribacter muris]MBF0786165.1 hypothetical protein [Muribacter muris]MBF0828304.1 hypothetical protein [Muribacter muris]TFV07689.1 hypothetical protein E4T80_11905 [Muribacter muris]